MTWKDVDAYLGLFCFGLIGALYGFGHYESAAGAASGAAVGMTVFMVMHALSGGGKQ